MMTSRSTISGRDSVGVKEVEKVAKELIATFKESAGISRENVRRKDSAREAVTRELKEAERRWAAQLGRQGSDLKVGEKAADKSERATIARKRGILLEIAKANSSSIFMSK